MDDAKALESERFELLRRVEDWLETPMVVLGFVWLALLIAESVWGTSFLFEGLGTIIWIITWRRCIRERQPTRIQKLPHAKPYRILSVRDRDLKREPCR